MDVLDNWNLAHCVARQSRNEQYWVRNICVRYFFDIISVF